MKRSEIASVVTILCVAAPAAAEPIGTWVNPSHTVEVVTRDCGKALCGWVTWSTADAALDAAAAGTSHLIGTEVLLNYLPAAAANWRERVLVPDMGRTFDSMISHVDANNIRVSGCVLYGLACRSEIWTRVDSK